jgi:hypothetical protein
MFRTGIVLVAAMAAALLPGGRPVLAGEIAKARPETVGLSTDRLARIDAAVTADVAANRMAGAVVAVARRGKLVHLRAYAPRRCATTAWSGSIPRPSRWSASPC